MYKGVEPTSGTSHCSRYECCIRCRAFMTLQRWSRFLCPPHVTISLLKNLKDVAYCVGWMQTSMCTVSHCEGVKVFSNHVRWWQELCLLDLSAEHPHWLGTHIHRCRQSTAWRSTAIWPTTEHAQKTPDFDHELSRGTIVLLKPWHHSSPRVQVRTRPGDGDRPPPPDPAELDQGGISNIFSFVVGVLSTRL